MAEVTPGSCPTHEQLAELMEDSASASDRARLEDHLEHCEACRFNLEQLAIGPEEWEAWARKLRDGLIAWPTVPAAPDADGSQPWPTITGYQITREIGRGGMGVVYQANQNALSRTVAVKVIHASRQNNPEYCQRFRQEATILARLRHPNIVQVYDFGESDGSMFLALELIDGGSLAEGLREQTLSAPEAARLVEVLARAIHSAHLAGIVHRDLKPANVLLASTQAGDSEPSAITIRSDYRVLPKLTDFGLAMHAELPRVTQTGSIMGTPEYMAPEQARGAPEWSTPAVDIYGLGVILYESLTGRPPFRAPTALATMRMLTEAEPVSPSRLHPNLPRDLETICLKCLRKSPGERYATAADLADDLRRFQTGQPIVARPIPFWARAGRWTRRHPVVASMSILLLALVIGLLAQWLRFAAHLNKKNADLERLQFALAAETRVVESQKLENEEKQQTIDKQRRKMSADLADAVRGIHEYSEIIRNDRLLTTNRSLRARVMKKTLATYSAMVAMLQSYPELRWDLARSYRAMGGLSLQIGKQEDAANSYKKALDLWESIAASGEVTENNQSIEPGNCLLDFANLAAVRSDLTTAEDYYQRAARTLEALAPAGESAQAARDTSVASARNQRASILFNKRFRRYEEAERELNAAMKAAQNALKLAETSERRRIIGEIAYNRGKLFEIQEKWSESRISFEEAVAIHEKLALADPYHFDHISGLAAALRSLGLWHRRNGSPEDALVSFSKALALRMKIHAAYPQQAGVRYEVGLHESLIAEMHVRAGRTAKAAEGFDRAIPLLLQSAKEAPTMWAYAQTLGEVVVLASSHMPSAAGDEHARNVEAVIQHLQSFTDQQSTPGVRRSLIARLERIRKK